jgi:hypothetical protein
LTTGHITPSEASEIAKLIDSYVKAPGIVSETLSYGQAIL